MAFPVSSALYRKLKANNYQYVTVPLVVRKSDQFSFAKGEDASNSAAKKKVAKEIGTTANKRMKRGPIHKTVTKLEPR